MPKKDGEHQLDGSCEKLSIKKSQGGDDPTYNKKKEGQLDWSHIVKKLPSKTHY